MVIDRTFVAVYHRHPETLVSTRLFVTAIIGSTLIAILLTGLTRHAASSVSKAESPEIGIRNKEGKRLFAAARYIEARDAFRSAAELADRTGCPRAAAMNLNNAGLCSLVSLQFQTALRDFGRARSIAESSNELRALIFTLNSLASLYIQMGQPENAVRVSREALSGPAGHADADNRAKLLYQLAFAEMRLNRFDEAEPVSRQAIEGLLAQKDFEAASRALSAFGAEFLAADRPREAECALNDALSLIREHKLKTSANMLAALAKLKTRQGETREAARLFDAALALPPDITPIWILYADRGEFRLKTGDSQGARADFRAARRIATDMRVEIVPADQDRVALESGLSLVMQGLVDAGNRIARQTGDGKALQETFDAAEQDRLWSLRALVPSPNDWRTRLPEHYWELLARYQALERSAAVNTSPQVEKNVLALRQQLQQIEAAASGTTAQDSAPSSAQAESALAHVRSVLDEDSVLFSFHITKTSSWVWAVDRGGVNVYPLPAIAGLQKKTENYLRALRQGESVEAAGRELYVDLFGGIPERYVRHGHWLLELDGPLYGLPLDTLVVGEDARGPIYLVERAALQLVPGALLLERGEIPADGEFLGLGDPVYNTADARFAGARGKSEMALPRLPNTAAELQACARAWNSPQPRLLIGEDAQMAKLLPALKQTPAIVHFATHVVASEGEFQSGVIALGLDPRGAMGLLGPREIVARPISASLVVMDGCHSAQGEALPGAGLMGLTRAWIGAGAKCVMATQWDVPDQNAQTLMADFYKALRVARTRGPAFALRQAQLLALGQGNRRHFPALWAGYFLISRMA